MNVSIFDNDDGTITVFTPTDFGLTLETLEEITARSTPIPDTPFDVIDRATLPSDKIFRKAWVRTGPVVSEDLTRCKDVTHDRRRAWREAEFAPLDAIIALNIPGADFDAAEAARVVVRDKDDAMQIAIDSAGSPAALRALIAVEGI